MAGRVPSPWWAPALAALTLVAGAVPPAAAASTVVPGSLAVRVSARSPVVGGRVDAAFQRAVDEAFRRAVLEALRTVAPERQSPRDLEIWQDTVLPRAGDFVGAWRILAQREQDGFLEIEAEVEVWREKLAATARSPAAAAAALPAVRVVILAEPAPLLDPAADEEVDAGRAAAAALEAELARRGAVIIASGTRAPWREADGPASEENRAALASAEGRRLETDAVLIVQIAIRGGSRLALSAQLIGTSSESTLATARAEAALASDVTLAETLAGAAAQIAAAVSPRLPAARAARPRSPVP